MSKQRFWLYQRGGRGSIIFRTPKPARKSSLHTRSKQGSRANSQHTQHDSPQIPVIGMSLAKAYLTTQDPKMMQRTWQDVMNQFCSRGKPQTQADCYRIACSPTTMLIVET